MLEVEDPVDRSISIKKLIEEEESISPRKFNLLKLTAGHFVDFSIHPRNTSERPIMTQNDVNPVLYEDAQIHPAIALIELEEGTRIVGNLPGVPPEKVRVGMPVEVSFARVADEWTLPQWRPKEEPTR